MKKIIASIIFLFVLSIFTHLIIEYAKKETMQQGFLAFEKQENISSLAGSWMWIETRRSEDVITPEFSEDFILTIDEIGRVETTTDCNIMSGSVLINNNFLNFGGFNERELECRNQVQEPLFMFDLKRTQTFEIFEDVLVLNIIQSNGQMLFRRVGN